MVFSHTVPELYQNKVKFEIQILHALKKKKWFSGLKKINSRMIYKTLEFPDVASHKVLWISNAAAFTKHFDELSVN